MDCGKIKELILTGYVDNEIDGREKARLEAHCALCPGCKEYLEAVKTSAVTPFEGAPRREPPAFIWYRVKDAIMAEQRDKARRFIPVRVPALAMATIMGVTLVVVSVTALRFHAGKVAEAEREEQIEYAAYSMEAPANGFLNNEGGLGTSVENYFL